MYRFQPKYELEDFLILNHVADEKNGRGGKILLILSPVFFVDVAALIGLYFSKASIADNWRYLCFLTVAGIILSAYLFPRGLARESQKRGMQNLGEVTIVLDENGIRESCGKGDTQRKWSAVVVGYYCRGRYFLFVDNCYALILPERALVEGDPAGLRVFLEDRLQMEIKEIR